MAPRPIKPRKCCSALREFGTQIFKPAGTPLLKLEQTKLFPDELEAMHLCDSLGLTQQLTGERMGISRGTVQRLVARGRKKLIEALLEGRAIVLTAEELSANNAALQQAEAVRKEVGSLTAMSAKCLKHES